MDDKRKELWKKSAVIGAIWAASEITLGSFMHNARIPFKGQILTGIGIAVMMACNKLWPQRGLLWRAGFICAVMKAISPSAALAGPMIAISAEGLLAEAGILIGGPTLFGRLLGGGLAMSWALFHKLVNLLIFYGSDAVGVYIKTLEWFRGYANIKFIDPWLPFFIAAGVFFLAGVAAAAVGVFAASCERKESIKFSPAAGLKIKKETTVSERKFSLALLFLHFVFITAILSLGKRISVEFMYTAGFLYAVFCAFRYRMSMRLVKRYGVWLGVFAASALSGAILSSVQAGLYMFGRAFIVTFAMSAIGSELVNPKIKNMGRRVFGGVFFDTLEYSFAALPVILSSLPEAGLIARHPLKVLNGVVYSAPELLEMIDEKNKNGSV